MTQQEFFGEWWKCIDEGETNKIFKFLVPKAGTFSPKPNNIFKAFQLCPYDKLSVVFLGQDPYPNKLATGLLFANEKEFISPSLKIIKKCVEDLEFPYKLPIFAPDLEAWAKQGVLLLNTSLTCKLGEVGSHSLVWKQWMIYLLRHIAMYNNGLVWVLFGAEAQSFEKYLGNYQTILKVDHPAYLARRNECLPSNLLSTVNEYLKLKNNKTIKWYENYKIFD